MSVDTQTAPESVVPAEDQNESTAPVLPTVPAEDSDVRNHQQIKDRIRDLLLIAAAVSESRDAMTERALTLAVNALTVSNPGAVVRERVLMHFRDDIDSDTGRGKSQRFHYPRERSDVLIEIAHALGLATELTHRPYMYPANSKRKQFTVELFGAEQDIARVITIREYFDARILDEIARIEFKSSDGPGAQTKIKRKHIADVTKSLSEQLAKLLAQNERASEIAAKRRTKSDNAKQEWITTAS